MRVSILAARLLWVKNNGPAKAGHKYVEQRSKSDSAFQE